MTARSSSDHDDLSRRLVEAIEHQALAAEDMAAAVRELDETVRDLQGDLSEALKKLSLGNMVGGLFGRRGAR